jgi:hypothetical protein
MRLPNADRAWIDPRKITDYALSPVHPHGRTHSLLFQRLLGLGQAQAAQLIEALRRAALECDAVETTTNQHGTKYEVRFPMTGPRGEFRLLSVWIIPTGETVPHLVTVYVE